MRLTRFVSYCICAFLLINCANGRAPAQVVALWGVGEISGRSVDASGLNDILADGTPHNQFGGISAIDRIGESNEYLALSDRGPQDGAVPWKCRFHRIRIELAAQGAVRVELLDTILLRDPNGVPLTGSSAAFGTSEGPQRFDPEGIRWLSNDRILISDEYGPHLWEFDLQGKFQRTHQINRIFCVEKCAPGNEETQINTRGRQANRGLEGLAVSHTSDFALGAMQSPLIQDAERDEQGALKGLQCRLVGFDLKSNQSNQCVYLLDAPSNKLSEILAADEGRFLVIERDGLSGSAIKYQRVMEIDVRGATDVSKLESLKSSAEKLDPVQKRTVVDMLDPSLGLAGESMPEKIEGLCWGPDLPDGRRTLLIAVDNDFVSTANSLFYVLALGQSR